MSAKALVLRPVAPSLANAFVHRWHVSRTHVRNSQVHLGAFLHGVLVGVLSFGPPLDRSKVLALVRGTRWPEVVELNRMCFSDAAPRNSESRSLSVALRLLRQYAPQVKWLLTFADATRSGDGAVYRACGFVLTGVRRNTTVWELDGQSFTDLAWKDCGQQHRLLSRVTVSNGALRLTGSASMRPLIEAGARPLPGFQVRYVAFIDAAWRDRLTVPALDYGVLAEMGARMYRGRSVDSGTAAPAAGEGANPIRPLHAHTEAAHV